MNNFQIEAFVLFFLPLFFSVAVFYCLFYLKNKILPNSKVLKQYKKNKRWGGLIVGILFITSLSFFQYLIEGFLLPKDFWSLILGIIILFVGGFVDDLSSLSWKKQLIFQLCAASLAVFVGDTINHIRLPWGEVFFFPAWLSILSAYLWIIIVINSLNWFDGVDGLAGSISVINLLVLSVLSATSIVNQPNTSLLCLILSGITLGFLYFNFYPARVFLGSSGVWIIGFIIAVISIYSGGKIATTALIFGFPLIDFLFVSAKRIAQGKSPTIGNDRLHFHHSLLDKGWKHYEITAFISLVSLALGIGAISFETKGKFFLFIFLIAFFLFFAPRLRKLKHSREK